jgi:SPP1 family predicted phage head-tail adaptor
VTHQNEFGEHARSWQTIAEVWACVEQTGGNEGVQAGQTHATGRCAVTIRHMGGVDEKCRLRLLKGGAILAVESAEDYERRGVALILSCVEDKQRV